MNTTIRFKLIDICFYFQSMPNDTGEEKDREKDIRKEIVDVSQTL